MLGWLTKTRRATTYLAAAATAAAVLVVPAMTAAPSAQAAAQSAVRSAPDRYENRIVYWTNVKRKRHGLRPLRKRACTDQFAESWSRKLAHTTRFYHQDVSRMFRCRGTYLAGENLARGGFTPRRVVNAWMRSPAHRANLLKPRYTHIGVGAVRSMRDGRMYIAQTFTG